jgi:hypothetical protein
MSIADDISIAINGDIRHTGDGSTYYTVLALKNFLGALLDDAQAAGDDLADITTDTIYERSTDEILTLNSPYNVDDTLIEHLYDGSITQNDGDDVYSGLYVVGVVESGTEPMIVQDNKVLVPYWGTGINADAAENVLMKLMVKSRSGGADINNKKVRVLARRFGDSYAEFDVTLGLANATAAIFTADDLNNEKSAVTIEGYTSIVNTEGFQELDIDGTGAAGQEFYSKWDIGTQTLNDTYERTKWVQKRAGVIDSCAETGDDNIVDNATITGQAMEFSARAQDEILVEARFTLKIGAGTPTGDMIAKLYDSDDASPAAPTGAVLATSEVVDSNRLTSVYQEVIFRFDDKVTLTASQEYCIVIEHADGTAGDYISVQGDATSVDDGNRAHNTAGWTGVATSSLTFTVKSCPIIHGIAGELFRGINFEVVYDGQSGTFTEDEITFWGAQITYDTLVGGPFTVGEYVKFYDIGTTTVINGGKVLKDTGTILTVALENISGSILADGDHITGLSSGATADIHTTITDDTKAGGEGLLLAADDNTPTGEHYIQLLYGAAPVDNLLMVGRSSAALATVNVTVNTRTISAAFVGQSTGTNIIGAYGIGFDPNDVGSSDKFFDLANAQRTPPNNVTFTVAGLVSGEDRVLVGPRSGSALAKDQYTLNTSLSGGTETAVVLTGAIQTETPSEGTTGNSRLRVECNSGIYKRQPYTSWSASTFVIPSTSYVADPATQPKDIFVAYIDVLADAATEAFTAVHSTNRDILIRVRDGGATPIKTVESSAQFTGSAQTVTINRVSDA